MLREAARELMTTQTLVNTKSLEEDFSNSDVEMSESEEGNQVGDVQQNGFKNLMCPLCLNVMYKSTTTACGHSFCERCLDEYLIIRKVRITS